MYIQCIGIVLILTIYADQKVLQILYVYTDTMEFEKYFVMMYISMHAMLSAISYNKYKNESVILKLLSLICEGPWVKLFESECNMTA